MTVHYRFKLLFIILMFNNAISPVFTNYSKEYFQLFCSFLKFSHQCEKDIRSQTMLMPFDFHLNLKKDCQLDNQVIIDDVYLKSVGTFLYSYSVFDFRFESMNKPKIASEPNLSTITYVPMSDIAIALSNKNIPTLFLYVEWPKNLSAKGLSKLKLDVQIGNLINSKKLDKNLLLNDTIFSYSTGLNKSCRSLGKVIAKDSYFKNLSRFNQLDMKYNTDLLSSLSTTGFSSKTKFDDDQTNRPVRKQLELVDNHFSTYFELPSHIENNLKDDQFIYQQLQDRRALVFELRFTFENVLPDIKSLMTNELMQSIQGSIVMHNCAKVNRFTSFVIHKCQVSIEFGYLDCKCEIENLPAYFTYSQFVSIFCLILFSIFFVRLSRGVFLEYFNRILLFEKTKADRTIFILCSSRNALFDYILTFELGCPTNSFDFEKSFICFDLQGPDNRTMAQGRILCKLLAKERINKINFKIKRLTQLNRDMLDSITIQHTCSNPNAKIFLYDIILKQVTEQKKSVFSINDYVRSYKQKYILTVSAYSTLNHSLEGKLESKEKFDFKNVSIQGMPNQDNISPISIKSCELYPARRLGYEKYPDLNDFEIELLLIFSSLISFLIIIWLTNHKLCNQRTIGCYFTYFKIDFMLTFSFYLIIYLLYKFIFKNEQMKAIYFKRTSTIWSFSSDILQFFLITASAIVLVILYHIPIQLYAFEFFACSLTMLYIIPLFILSVDLLNIVFRHISFLDSMSLKPLISRKSSSDSQQKAIKDLTKDRSESQQLAYKSIFDESRGLTLRTDTVDQFKSSEFKPQFIESQKTLEDENTLKEFQSNELNEAFTDLKRFSKHPNKRPRSNSTKSTKSIQSNQEKSIDQ